MSWLGNGAGPVALPDPGGDLLDLPLVQASDGIFTRIGQISIPTSNYDNGGGGMSVTPDGDQLYVSGLRTAANLGRWNLPAGASGSATNSLSPVSISGTFTTGLQAITTGSLVYGGNLYVSRAVDYDGDGNSQVAWIKRADLNMGSQGSPCGMAATNGAYQRRLSQGLVHIPTEWQSLLGGPAATLGCRLSIVSAAQCGYGFAVFDPENVSPGGGNVPVTPLLDYPVGGSSGSAWSATQQSLEPVQGYHSDWGSYPKNANGGTDLYSVTNAFIGTAFIVPGSRSLLIITCHGYGVADNGCRPGSSVNNSPFRIQVVPYDLRDLVAVKNGLHPPYWPRPYAWWELPGWNIPWGNCVGNSGSGAAPGNFCWIPQRNWLVGVADGTGGFPSWSSLQVWSVASL